jgi:hypothetical protein
MLKFGPVRPALLRSIDCFIAVSRYSAEWFAAWSKIAQDQFFILPNCVDLNLLIPQPRNANLAALWHSR